jgi:hypothetical protein
MEESIEKKNIQQQIKFVAIGYISWVGLTVFQKSQPTAQSLA